MPYTVHKSKLVTHPQIETTVLSLTLKLVTKRLFIIRYSLNIALFVGINFVPTRREIMIYFNGYSNRLRDGSKL